MEACDMNVKRMALLGVFAALGVTTVLLLLASSPVPVARANDLTVCPSGPPDCGYTVIQDAVDDASNGDVIKVATGIYADMNDYEGLAQIVYISKTVTIRGGYVAPDFSDPPNPDANPTTLDAQSNGRVMYITGNISPTIDGLILTNGQFSGSGQGVYVISATITFENNLVQNNRWGFGGSGGGIALFNANGVFRNNTIRNNNHEFYGGGVFLRGSSATFANNIIGDNSLFGFYPYARGGGLYCDDSNVMLVSNRIQGNAAGNGGGLYLESSSATLINNVVTDNTLTDSGGQGSGIKAFGASVRLIHNTLARNRNGDGSGLHVTDDYWNDVYSQVWLTNTIVVSHSVGITVAAGNTATLEATLWGMDMWANGTDWGGKGAITTGTVNIWADPLFVDPAAGDYHIQPASPAVDAGVDADASKDIDGDFRPYGAGLDIGADEIGFCDDVSEIPKAECQALVALYYSTDGDHWLDSSGWLATTTPCSWHGVVCNPGHVTELHLGSNQLNGTIPASLNALTNLEELWLSSNQLAGDIPPELGDLSSLRDLYLNDNVLAGTIPPQLGSLGNLEVLYFYTNELIGTIPPELGNLSNLWALGLGENRLTGTLPLELAHLGSLRLLLLYDNDLEGGIPPFLGDLTELRSLDLGHNQFSGSIPPELGQLANLETLGLGSNQLSGELPPELGDLVSLEDLWLYHNRLSGTIPSTLGDLANLQYLRLDANQLSGVIPAELANLSSLSWLSLAYNMLIAEDPALLAFLSEHDPDWADTQTVPPTGLGATAVTSSTVELSWTPISYTSDGGYYEISYSTVQGGPYTIYDHTEDKEASGYLVDGLLPDMQYYFVLRTYTPARANQQNELWSWYSEEASAATPAVLCDPVSAVQLSRIPAGDLYAGTTVYFSAIAGGTVPFTYTWTLDGVPVDEDRSTYDHTFESAGTYSVGVAVSNACGESEGTLAVVVEDAVSGSPDLSLSQKTASLTSVESGDLLTYTLLLRNVSPVQATVALTDTVPEYTSYVAGSAHASDAGEVALLGDDLLWAGQVISGTPVIIDFAVEVESPPVGTQIVNTAYLGTGTGNPAVIEATSTCNLGYGLSINDGALFTEVPTVTLRYAWNVDDAITHVKFSNDRGFVPGEHTSDWLPVDPADPTLEHWLLDTYGDLRMSRTVYARFRDSLGNQFGPIQDDIVFDPDVPAVTGVEILEPDTGDARALAESEVIVRVTSSDSNTGVSVVQIAENAGFDGYLEFPVLGPTTDIPWTLEGSSYLYVRVVDRAGNVSEAASAPTFIGFKVYIPIVLRDTP